MLLKEKNLAFYLCLDIAPYVLRLRMLPVCGYHQIILAVVRWSWNAFLSFSHLDVLVKTQDLFQKHPF